MKRLLSVLVIVGGCGGTEEKPPPKVEKIVVDVDGSVEIHPLEVAWRAADTSRGAAPSLVGAKIDVEDALQAVQGGPPLASTTVGADLKWKVEKVDVTNVTLALVGGVKDTTGLISQSGYGLVRGRPSASLTNKPLYVLSRQFVEALAAAVELTAADLDQSGFVFGQIVDAERKGVAGGKLAKTRPDGAVAVESTTQNPVYYLKPDLSGVADAETTAGGAFLYLPPFGTAEYTALKTGAKFAAHLVGARKNTVLSVFFTQTP